MKRNPIATATLLATLENQVEIHLREAVAIFQNLPIDILLRPSPTGGWSIAQCLDHLNSYGNFYIPHFKKGIDRKRNIPASDTFKSTWFGNYFTRMMHPDTGKKKFRALKNYTPSPILDARRVIAIFIEQQETMLGLLNESRSANLNTIRIPLSLTRLVTFKLGDAFQFLIAHNERHMRQAKQNVY
jgi:hypothetical protein